MTPVPGFSPSTDMSMTQFDDIRPYSDCEVAPVIKSLLSNAELADVLSQWRYPRLSKWLPGVMRFLVRQYLARQLSDVDSVEKVQLIVERYMKGMIDQKVGRLTFSGLDKLDPKKSYLFVSNHRDIAMDPAFVNWVLYHNGFDTVRIAIGDNLLTKPFASDLMRLNKCFIVNRSATAPREKFKAAKHLSAYIHHSIAEESCNLWIAQREGRAKDGLDLTNTAIVSMFALSKSKKQDYSDYLRELNIVPVAISYEWDPCDRAKANELYIQDTLGNYEKSEHEDIASIAAGISGEKGNVHVAFGEVLRGGFDSADAVAAEIDQQIWSNYVLHPSNLIAFQKLRGELVDYPVGCEANDFVEADYLEQQAFLEQRCEGLDTAQREIFLSIYANPVVSKLSLAGENSVVAASTAD